jgi:selenocysteine lyase/cysteine desulfurase
VAQISTSWREQFPVTASYAYLDHASVGPLSRPALDTMTGSLASQASRGSLDHPQLHEMAEDARGRFATLIGTSPRQIAYVPSTSAGISMIASGLDLKAGDEVVAPAIEFPSAVLPWVLLGEKGVVLRRIPCQDGQVSIDALLDACNRRTRVISTSWIQFSSGFRLDLLALGDACRKRGIFLVIDGMQGVGALDIDVGSLPIDALVTQSYKWLLGPQGVGWLYMSERLSAATGLTAAGVRTREPRESYFDHALQPRDCVARFESGILDFHAIGGATASQGLLMDVGMSAVEDAVIELGDRLRAGLSRMGCGVLGGAKTSGLRSQIVAFKHPRRSAQECVDALLARGVVTSVRENHVRVSPHFYNTPPEIDLLLSVLN